MRQLGVFLIAALAIGTGVAHAAPSDTLTLGLPLEPPGLDPTAGAASAIREVTYANIFQGLTHIDENGQVQPDLASGWEISKDGLTYTFKLRSGVSFHDGTPFDCSIVKFSYERAAAPDSVNAQKQTFRADRLCRLPVTRYGGREAEAADLDVPV